MCKIAFLYPGQGAQQAGMGADFYENGSLAKSFLDKVEGCLDFHLKEVCFRKDERLNKTEYTQPAMVSVCLAMTLELTARGVKPDITAGLSLGEYAAVAAAGAFNSLDAVRLARKRGILMQNTVPEGEGGMCAILGMETEAAEKILREMEGVSIANYNCPGQIVITGKKESVKAAAERLKTAGAKRTVPLNVSSPFHSPLLVPAGEELKKEIEKISVHPLEVPYVANVTAEKVENAGRICGLLSRGVSSPVKWQQSMEYMIAGGVDTFVEIGPGRTLTGFLKKINKEVSVYHISTWDDMENIGCRLC